MLIATFSVKGDPRVTHRQLSLEVNDHGQTFTCDSTPETAIKIALPDDCFVSYLFFQDSIDGDLSAPAIGMLNRVFGNHPSKPAREGFDDPRENIVTPSPSVTLLSILPAGEPGSSIDVSRDDHQRLGGKIAAQVATQDPKQLPSPEVAGDAESQQTVDTTEAEVQPEPPALSDPESGDEGGYDPAPAA